MGSRKIIQVEDKVPFNLLVPLSIQHMFAMFGEMCIRDRCVPGISEGAGAGGQDGEGLPHRVGDRRFPGAGRRKRILYSESDRDRRESRWQINVKVI